MVTYLGVNKTLVDAGGIATITQGIVDGRVKVMLDYYTMLASEASGSVIKIGGPLQKGANVIAIMLSASVAQASLTVSVGDPILATRYGSALTTLQTALVPVWIQGKGYVIGTGDTGTTEATMDHQILLTTGGATSTAGIIYAAIFYTID